MSLKQKTQKVMTREKAIKAYITKVHAVILWHNDIYSMAQILNSTGKTSNNISKASHLQKLKIKWQKTISNTRDRTLNIVAWSAT